MIQICAVSGAILAELDGEEWSQMVESGKCVRDLKRFLAARIGHPRFRQRLLGEGMMELPDDMSLTSLTLALTPSASLHLVLLNFCDVDESAEKALVRHCEENRLEEVEMLLQRPQDPSRKWAKDDNEHDFFAPIHRAASNGHLEVVQLLLEAGAEKNAAAGDGSTALHFAAQDDHAEVVQLLLGAGADENAVDAGGGTALHYAAQYGYVEVARLLLETGIDKDAGEAEGLTAFMLATYFDHLEVAQLLLDAGADKNAAMPDGRTAWDLAMESGLVETLRFLREADK